MKKAVKTVGFIAVAMLFSKVLGLFRDAILANCYGTGLEFSAFAAASQIPISFFDITYGSAILSTFIPVFNRILKTDGKQKAFDFSNNFINISLLVSVGFCAIGMLFPQVMTRIFAGGLAPEYRQLTASLLILLLPTTIFTTLAYAMVGILQSLDEFNVPAVISLVSNGVLILYLLFFNQAYGIYGLAAAMLIGWGLQVAVQIPSLIKKGYRYHFLLRFKDAGIAEVLHMALPVLVSSWVQPLSVLINKNFASYIDGGTAIAGLDYANRIYIILAAVFAFAITNYIFPALSRLSGAGDADGFADVVKQSVRTILLIILPVMLGVMLLARQVITLVYARGQFDAASVDMTSTALFYYAIGMLAFGVSEIINKAFYAAKDAKKPMGASICGILTTLTLSFTLTRVFGFGVGALALSAAVSAIVQSAVLLVSMNKRVGFLTDKTFLTFVWKVVSAAALMLIAAWGVKTVSAGLGILAQIPLTAAVGAAVYGGALYVLKIEVRIR